MILDVGARWHDYRCLHPLFERLYRNQRVLPRQIHDGVMRLAGRLHAGIVQNDVPTCQISRPGRGSNQGDGDRLAGFGAETNGGNFHKATVRLASVILLRFALVW